MCYCNLHCWTIRGDCEHVRLALTHSEQGCGTGKVRQQITLRYGQKPTANNRAPKGEWFGRK